MKIQKKNGGGVVWSGRGGVRVYVNEELKFLRKFTKKIGRGGQGVRDRGVRRVGGQSGCERRIEVLVKNQKNGGGGSGRRGGEVRVDVNDELKFLGKFKKKNWGGGGGSGRGVRVDVNEELKFLRKLTKKNWEGDQGVRDRGVHQVGGQSGCERRIEVFVKNKKKWGGCRVGGGGRSGWM